MWPLLGAASSAIDLLASLTSSKSSATPATGVQQNNAARFDISDAGPASARADAGSSIGGGSSQLSPETMSALLAAQGQSPTVSSTSRASALKDLFGLIDGDGDGSISKSEFENALGAGGTNLAAADKVFGELDKDDDGAVSLGEMTSALKGGHGHHHPHAAKSDGDADGANSDPLLQALNGASSSSVTNSDGSVTTTLSYADGSKVTMTSATAPSTGASSYNFIEQLIQRQAEAISSQATSSVSLSA